MKEKILKKSVEIIVIVIMVVIANYPLYKNLKSTADDLNKVVQTVQDEVVAWQKDVNKVQDRVEEIRIDINNTIDSGLGQIDSTLIKIKALESDVKVLVDKIDNLKLNSIDKIDEIKEEPIETVKDLFKIRG